MQRKPWFSNTAFGVIFLVPRSLWGWIASVVYIIIIAATAVSSNPILWFVRFGVTVAYLALSYAKSEK